MGKYWMMMVLVSLLVVMACAPAAAPAPPVPAPAAPAPAPAPAVTPEDAAWAKVVSEAKKEGVVTLYSTAFVADIGRRITRDFADQFGIQVEIMSGNGRTLYERIRVEQAIKKQIGDVFIIGGAGSTSELVLKGGAERIAQELPALRDKAAFKADPVYSPGGEIIVWVVSYASYLINTKLVKPEEEPKSYSDLLDPKWKGRMLSADPRTTGGSTPFYYNLRYHKVVDLDFYRRLAQQDIKEWAGNPREAYRMVARGEFPIYLGGSTDSTAPIIAEGGPIKTMNPEEGVSVNLGNILMAKGAPHPNAAKLFINWLVSPPGQIAYTQSASSTPVRKDVPDASPPAARFTPEKVWPRTWDMEEWAVKDQAAGILEKIFGKK